MNVLNHNYCTVTKVCDVWLSSKRRINNELREMDSQIKTIHHQASAFRHYTYKQEYDERSLCVEQFIKYYNEERLHQGIGYLTPREKWEKLKSVQI